MKKKEEMTCTGEHDRGKDIGVIERDKIGCGLYECLIFYHGIGPLNN